MKGVYFAFEVQRRLWEKRWEGAEGVGILVVGWLAVGRLQTVYVRLGQFHRLPPQVELALMGSFYVCFLRDEEGRLGVVLLNGPLFRTF